jgi:hypothetical protein
MQNNLELVRANHSTRCAIELDASTDCVSLCAPLGMSIKGVKPYYCPNNSASATLSPPPSPPEELKPGEGRFSSFALASYGGTSRVSVGFIRWRGAKGNQTGHHSLLAAARGGVLSFDSGASCRAVRRAGRWLLYRRFLQGALPQGGRAGRVPPGARNPFIVLTRATVALAFYPRPVAGEDVSSQRASRPDRRADLPPSCFFMCPPPPCLSRTLAGRAINAARRKERHGVWQSPLDSSCPCRRVPLQRVSGPIAELLHERRPFARRRSV